MKLRWNERLACLVMSHLRWNNNDEIYECLWNDAVIKIAGVLLGGLDELMAFTSKLIKWRLHDNDSTKR